MPTPAKAYTDPTGFIQAAWTAPQLEPRFDLVPLIAVVAPIPPIIGLNTNRIPFTGIDSTNSRVNQTSSAGGMWDFEIKIPTPPLGRQIISTFPSIYKERGASNPRPDHGLQWPRPVNP